MENSTAHCSASSCGMFLSCRRQAYWHLVRRLTPSAGNMNFDVGTIWHAGLDAWYTFGKLVAAKKAIQKAVDEVVKNGNSALATPAVMTTTRAMLEGMLLGYIERFGNADLKAWKFLKAEHEFSISQFLGSSVDFTGRIDGIVEIAKGGCKGTWILEHKTTRDLSYYSVETVKNAMQTLAYCAVLPEVLGIKPKGIIWNAVRKPSKRLKQGQTTEDYAAEIRQDYIDRPDFYYFRQPVFIPSEKIRIWETEMTLILQDLELCLKHKDDMTFWYKNTNQCTAYGGCAFIPLCFRGIRRSTLAMYRTIEK